MANKTNKTNKEVVNNQEVKNTVETIKNNSIINVSVHGLTASETVDEVITRIESVEKSIFNIAILASYGTGTTIPSYIDNMGNKVNEATCDKALNQKDYINMVGRSKGTISKWINAMNFIIENNYFEAFANGIYPFSYEKIIYIFKNKELFFDIEKKTLIDLMTFSLITLETMVADHEKKTKKEKTKETTKEETKQETGEKTTTEETTETSENAEETTEKTVITYDGKEYALNMDKATFEKWLNENTTVK